MRARLLWVFPLVAVANTARIVSSNQVIEDMRITSLDGDCLVVTGSNVIIRNSIIGPCKGAGILVQGSTNVEVSGNSFEDTTVAVNAVDSTGINIHDNRFLSVNVDGGHVVFNAVHGSGNFINDNNCESRFAQPTSIHLSLDESSGTAADPIVVSGNKLKGGGTGISTTHASHLLIKDNALVDTGAVGIAVSNGESVDVQQNSVYARSQPWTKVGLRISGVTTSCSRHTVAVNRIRFYGPTGLESPVWNSGGCGAVRSWPTNDWHATLDSSLWTGIPDGTLLSGASLHCEAEAEGLTEARDLFATVCAAFVRKDCDPTTGAAWLCSSKDISPTPSP